MKVHLSPKFHKIHNRLASNYDPHKFQPNIGLRQQYKYARNHAYRNEGLSLIPWLIALYGAATNQLKVVLIGGAGGSVINKVARTYQQDAAKIKNLHAYQAISQRATRIFSK